MSDLGSALGRRRVCCGRPPGRTSAFGPSADLRTSLPQVRLGPETESCDAAFTASKSVMICEQMQFSYIGEFYREMVAEQGVGVGHASTLGAHNVPLLFRQLPNEACRQSAVHISS